MLKPASGFIKAMALAAFVSGVFAAPGLVQQAQASPAAEAFVRTNVNRGLQILNNPNLSKAQRQEQFRGFLLNLTDLQRIAMYTLGPARRMATAADQQAFVEAFRNYAFAVYGAEFSKYAGQTLRITGSYERGPGDELVRTVLVDPQAPAGQQPIEVDFRVYGSGGHFSVVDIVVAGLDLAITEQDDFGAFLSQHNNDIRALTANLQQRAARVRSTGQI